MDASSTRNRAPLRLDDDRHEGEEERRDNAISFACRVFLPAFSLRAGSCYTPSLPALKEGTS